MISFAKAGLGVLLLAMCTCRSLGMHEEQAGKYDWLRTHIGRVSVARMALRSRSRVFVSTEAAVVAALDLRNGDVIWRQVLNEAEKVDRLLLLARPAAVASLSTFQGWVPFRTTFALVPIRSTSAAPSSSEFLVAPAHLPAKRQRPQRTFCRYLRVWNAADGVLLWDRYLGQPDRGQPVALAICVDALGDKATSLAVLSNSKLQVLHNSTAQEVLESASVLQASAPPTGRCRGPSMLVLTPAPGCASLPAAIHTDGLHAFML